MCLFSLPSFPSYFLVPLYFPLPTALLFFPSLLRTHRREDFPLNESKVSKTQQLPTTRQSLRRRGAIWLWTFNRSVTCVSLNCVGVHRLERLHTVIFHIEIKIS